MLWNARLFLVVDFLRCVDRSDGEPVPSPISRAMREKRRCVRKQSTSAGGEFSAGPFVRFHTCDFSANLRKSANFFFPNLRISANGLFTVFWKSAVFLTLFLGIPRIVFYLLKIPFMVERTVWNALQHSLALV